MEPTDCEYRCLITLTGMTYVVAVPRDDVEGTVVLGALEELSSQLVDDLPRLLDYLVLGNRVKEVAGIGKTVGTQRTQLGELKVGTPNLEDVATGRTVGKLDSEAETALDDDNLSGLDEERTELGLDVQGTLLRDDQEVTVRVDEGLLDHALVGNVDVGGQTLPESRVTRASNGLQTSDKVNLLRLWDIEWVPRQLGRRDVHSRVYRQEVGLSVLVVGQIGLQELSVQSMDGYRQTLRIPGAPRPGVPGTARLSCWYDGEPRRQRQ